ncbi:hypothetical protein [Corynebacterium sp.]|uniref:hypothetical protein n=1 Tax=Corynebacterium sp. TaxID=1720 RepID=UPI003B3B92C3
MNRMRHPGAEGSPHEIDILRRQLELSLQRSEAAHRDTVRITSELLAKLYGTVPAPPQDQHPTPALSAARPDAWPSAPAPSASTPAPPLAPSAGLPRAPRSHPGTVVSGPVSRYLEDKDKVTIGVSALGGVITVIGLVFLAVQAFSRGWLGPASAVSAAAVLCLLLITGGFAVHHRHPTGPTAPALVSVGVLGMFTDLWVLVFGLGWMEPMPGVVLVAGIAAAGLLTAWAWSHQVLAVILLIAGTGFLTPAVLHLLQVSTTHRFEALSLVVVALIGAAVTWHREWTAVSWSSAAVLVLGSVVLYGDGQRVALTVCALTGAALMTWLALSAPGQSAGLSAATRWIPASLVPVLLLLSDTAGPMSVTAASVACLAIAGAPVVGSTAASVFLGIPLRTGPPDVTTPGDVTPAPGVTAALCTGVAGLTAVMMVRQSDPFAVPSLWWMVALVALATTLVVVSDRLPTILVWGVFLVTLAYALPRAVPAWIETDVHPAIMWPVLLVTAAPGVMVLRQSRALGAARELTLLLAAVLLVVVSSAIPLIFLTVSDTDSAFMAGHLVMSVSWMSLGVTMLARDNGPAGLVLALLASAKLVFYDLSALAGLIQVAAFIICGAILLIAALLRERGRKAPGPSSDSL